jgi:hydroxymethylbilane synthase
MGVEGIFTKELDAALLNETADIAVHSLKDVPIQPALGLTIAAVAERGPHEDLIFVKPGFDPQQSEHALIATCSLRRTAQWLRRFPSHSIVSVRGNVDTRITKFRESDWDAMILAKAGVVRLGYGLEETRLLPWMLPSPGQGAIAVTCRSDDAEAAKALHVIHHVPTYMCVTIERDFLKVLHGGCSAPISAYAKVVGSQIHLESAVHSRNGSRCFEVKKRFMPHEWKSAGLIAAEEVLRSEIGASILDEIQEARKLASGNT